MTEAQWRPRDGDIELRTEPIVFHQGSLQSTVMIEPGDYPEIGQLVHIAGEPGSSLSLLGKVAELRERKRMRWGPNREDRLVKYYGLADPELEDLKVLGLVVDEGDDG